MVEKVKSQQLQQEKQHKGNEQQKSNAPWDSAPCNHSAEGSPSKDLPLGKENAIVGQAKASANFSRNGSHCSKSYRLPLILVVAASLLLTNGFVVDGASLNSTLVDELLQNSQKDHGLLDRSSEGISSTGSAPNNNSASVNGTAPLPPLHNTNDGGGEPTPSKNNHKRKIEYTYHHGPNEHHHINFTIPIHEFEKPPIIVKHGNIFYEVVDNGTISTNVGTIAIPIITAPLSAADRLGLFESMTATVLGLRVEKSAKGVSYDNGASKILANSPAVIRFFGSGFTNNTIVRFVTEEGARGEDCDDSSSTKYFHFDSSQMTDNSAIVTITLPPLNEDEKVFYVCVKENDTEMPFIHQGGESWIILTSYQKWLPLWAHVIILLVLLALSGLFSGLNLGLMAIDRTEIKIIMNAGSEKERRYAKQIRPLRDNGNYLLCSLLLGNVLVNASLTILLDDISSGLIAVVGSTVGIVIFGEIVPQAVCSRHGLAVGAKTVWITKFFMGVTFPLSYPISVILDKVLGKEIGNVYNRERLKELIHVTQGINDLEKQEVNIISGALDLKQKTVANVMTKLEEVYMLPIDTILDFDTVSEIMSNGYSRIPVFESQRGNVVSLLYTKDLAFVDPDDKMPLRNICEFYSNPCHFVFENVTLNVLFNVFKQGNKGHMAFVQRIKQSDKADPTYEVVGLITLEDVIEELIQEEINDETDFWESTNKGKPNKQYTGITDGAMTRVKTDGITVSPQLTLAAFQYLCTAVEEFNDTRISKTVLERLLKRNIYFQVKIKNKEKTDPTTILYERGKPADYFIMILEGRVNVEIGKESLLFEGGPFTFFGTSSLCPIMVGDVTMPPIPSTPLAMRKISQTSIISESSAIQPAFIPEYTVRAVTDVTYFQISRSMYQAAKQATMLEKTYNPLDSLTGEKIDEDDLQTEMDEMDEVDGKAKDNNNPLTVGKPIGRGSISEVLKGDRKRQPPTNEHPLFKDKRQMSLIGDNNNMICLSMAKHEDLSEGKQELTRRGSMSRVIICPNDERPSAELRRQHPDNTFVPGAIVDREDKYSCKL